MSDPIERWHAYVESRDRVALDELLAEDVVFESPVVFTPQRGKAVTMAYLTAAVALLGESEFAYEDTWRAERSAVLEFTARVEGIVVNGVDIVRWDDAGRIVHFKVMVRPLQAVNVLHRKMGEMLARDA